LRENELALTLAGGKPPADEALFALGLNYADARNPLRDYRKAADFFRKVSQGFPSSPVAEQARTWVTLLEERRRILQDQRKVARENERLSQENEKLKQVIEKSKQVDIEIEQKRRGSER
jgi:hypothetical protein